MYLAPEWRCPNEGHSAQGDRHRIREDLENAVRTRQTAGFGTEGVWSKDGNKPWGCTVDLSAISLANCLLPFWRAESSRRRGFWMNGAGHRSKTPSASWSGLAGNEPTEHVKDATEKQEKACGNTPQSP
ncbi:hypothetical protein B0H11DRAFT_1926083 [Mycena galericulata]|nr:hypothetical protein B0H11DRAFT_1926083 [Mycena galericulata]